MGGGGGGELLFGSRALPGVVAHFSGNFLHRTPYKLHVFHLPLPLPDPPRMCHHRLPRRPRHTTHKHLQKCMYYIYYTILYLLSHTRSHTIAYSLRLRGCSRRHRDTRLPVAPRPRRRKRRPCCKPLCLLTLRT